MEFFHRPNVNWLGWKWYFLAFSMVFSVAGIVKMSWNWQHIGSPVPLGVDFQGGTQVDVKFSNPPDIDAIRHAIDAAGVKGATMQIFGAAANHEVLISLPEQSNEAALDAGRAQIESALQAHYNNYFNPTTGVKVDVVGPTVGHQLEKQATLATLYSMAGMLIYLWFRFQLIYGVAAVVACFHDTLITVGAFALTGREISLTVIAAILTLVGYSMNDTIVVFDRIRENLRISRREPLPDLVNRSINQTLSRTVLTSGLTFLTVLSLFIFGGQVLNGFSFALVIGILIGTYSSIAVASPMLVAWQQFRAGKGKVASLPAARRGKA
ncbi:Protein-export membrane protein SecF [Candidatus Sulfotelmatomonas gaucii]|uniref:Protein-export membrane protein SecF n=1 Tax=Candidatus Sulfuritelmatomonas gaucii TaxID=2043161 RepID=A0A2N9LCI7_9BACT|nr:Protein-export membrane protein SecF [Candidatus Sulfotelmatomonas gaucii]